MATKITPAAKAAQKADEANANLERIEAEAAKVAEAIDGLDWEPGQSMLPLIDLERQGQELRTRLDSAQRIARRAAEGRWASPTPAVAEMLAYHLGGVFLEGAGALAFDTEPGNAEVDRPQFRVVQTAAHRIDANGAVRGRAKIQLVGPRWSQSIIDGTDKLGILDHLYVRCGVTPLNAGSGNREVARRWGADGLDVEWIGYGERPFTGAVMKGGLPKASLTGGWKWDQVIADALDLPGIVTSTLGGGGQQWTVTDTKVVDGVRTTALDLRLTVTEPATDANKRLATGAIEAMVGRGVLGGVGRITKIEIVGTEGWARPTYPGSTQEFRGFFMRAKAVAEGTAL